MNVRTDIFRFVGDVWKNCGDTPGQNAALRSDQTLSGKLGAAYGQIFGTNSAIASNLTNGLETISNAGASQQGFSPTELAARNGEAINAASASNQKLQTAIGEQGAAHGISGAPGVESGVQQAERASAATAVDTNLNNAEADITKQNYDVGRQNYWNSVQEIPAVNTQLENAATTAGNAATGANQATGAQANANAQDSTGVELLGLGEGLASDAATAVGCVTLDTPILKANGESVRADELSVGDRLYGLGSDEQVVRLETSVQPIIRVTLENGSVTDVSESHTFSTPQGGYLVATETAGRLLRTQKGFARVLSIRRLDAQKVVKICLSGMHTYVSNGIWSLE